MVEALKRHFPEEARWERPTGGLFVWVTLPEDFDGPDLFVAARRRDFVGMLSTLCRIEVDEKQYPEVGR